VKLDVVLAVAPLVGDLQDVAKSRRGDAGDGGAAPFDQRVGRQGGAVDEAGDLAERDAGRRGHPADSGQRALGRVVAGGQGLGGHRGLAVAGHQDAVGEGPADIDGDPYRRVRGHGKQ
jgi:hypothetical protein